MPNPVVLLVLFVNSGKERRKSGGKREKMWKLNVDEGNADGGNADGENADGKWMGENTEGGEGGEWEKRRWRETQRENANGERGQKAYLT